MDFVVERYGGKRGLLRHILSTLDNLVTGRFKPYQKLPPQVERVIFVCSGNICRSPLAHYAFKQHSALPVASIGISTETGKKADERFAIHADDLGIDLTTHQATASQDFESKPNDLFVCMEPHHLDETLKMFPSAKVVLLGAFGIPKRIYIHDPFAAPANYGRFCARYVVEATKGLASRLG